MPGELYVTELMYGCVSVFSLANHKFLRYFGGMYAAVGSLTFPVAVAVHPNTGDVVVVDQSRHPLQIFDRQGKFLRSVGVGELQTPSSICVNPATGRVYVVDYGNRRVVIVPGV